MKQYCKHCWGGPDSKCGANPEHLVCCGCGLSHPSIRSSITSAVDKAQAEFFDFMVTITSAFQDSPKIKAVLVDEAHQFFIKIGYTSRE